MITASQQASRERGIGGSDVPAVLGISPWRTAYDLWLERTGRAARQDAGEAAMLGNALEPILLRLAGERMKVRVVRPSHTFVGGKPHYRANIDGMIDRAARGQPIVEAKTTGYLDGWGADGTAEIPEPVRAQVTYQMAIASSTMAYVACLRADRGLSLTLHPVIYDDGYAEGILSAVDAFWQCVKSDTPPTNSAPSLDCAKRLIRDDESLAPVEVDAGVVQADVQAREALAQAQAYADACRARLLAGMGRSRNGVGGGFSVSIHRVNTERFDVGRFKAAEPQMVERFMVASGYDRVTVRRKA